jgi:class 3 adenylate cyclase
VTERPETRLIWNGDVSLAYQVMGTGGPALLYLQGWVSNIELNWDAPVMARFLRGLAQNRRLVMHDVRGMGVSERASPHDVWPLETVMDDLLVLLDEIGIDRISILATNEDAFVACMFAATYPERTDGLILYEAATNFLWSPETPWEWAEERFAQQEEGLRRPWTRDKAASNMRDDQPSMADDAAYVEWWYRYALLSQGQGHAIASTRKYTRTDLRGIVPSIHVPVLVLVRPDHPEPSWTDSARHLAGLIPGASLQELTGRDAYIWLGDQAATHRAVDEFLEQISREQAELDRVLATVLFTDLVGSTEVAAAVGDHEWRGLVERHHTAVRALLDRYRGTEVDTAGDGFFATFDGPARAIRCARAIVLEMGRLGLEVRAGVHTGEVEIIDGKAGGLTVQIGARVAAAAGPSEVLVSQTVKDLVAGSGLHFEERGEHELKGIPDRWRLYRAVDAPAPD